MPHIPCISSAATSRAMFASEEAAAVNNVKGLYERLQQGRGTHQLQVHQSALVCRQERSAK